MTSWQGNTLWKYQWSLMDFSNNAGISSLLFALTNLFKNSFKSCWQFETSWCLCAFTVMTPKQVLFGPFYHYNTSWQPLWTESSRGQWKTPWEAVVLPGLFTGEIQLPRGGQYCGNLAVWMQSFWNTFRSRRQMVPFIIVCTQFSAETFLTKSMG